MAAAEAAATEPGAFLTVRTLRLTPEHGERLTTALRDLASQPDDRDGQPYSLLPGLYEPDREPPPGT